MRLVALVALALAPGLALAQQTSAEELLEAYFSMALGGRADVDVQMNLGEVPVESHIGLLPAGHTVIGSYRVLAPPSHDVTAASTFVRMTEAPDAVVERYRAAVLPDGWAATEEASPFAGYFKLCGPGMQGRAAVTARHGGGAIVRVWTQPDPCPAPAPEPPIAEPTSDETDDPAPRGIDLPDFTSPGFYTLDAHDFGDYPTGPTGRYERFSVEDDTPVEDVAALAVERFVAEGWVPISDIEADGAYTAIWSRAEEGGGLVIATTTTRADEWGATEVLVTATR